MAYRRTNHISCHNSYRLVHHGGKFVQQGLGRILLHHFMGQMLLLAVFIDVKVEGRENIDKNKSYVFVANHQGAYDIFALSGYLGHNFCWMMRRALINIPFVGTACQMSGQILVDTHNAKALKKTMDDAKKRLNKGVSLCVFPEGRRTDTGKWAHSRRGRSNSLWISASQ